MGLHLLQGISQLRFHVGQRAADSLFSPPVVPLDLGVAWVGNFGVHFLGEQLFRGEPLLLGGGLKHLLFNQGIQGFPLDFVFLIAQRQKLPLNGRSQIVVVDGLAVHCGNGLFGFGGLRILRHSCRGKEGGNTQ